MLLYELSYLIRPDYSQSSVPYSQHDNFITRSQTDVKYYVPILRTFYRRHGAKAGLSVLRGLEIERGFLLFDLDNFVTRRLALYDILDLGMVGVIMGWPFGLVATIASKALHALINDTWVVKLLGRRRGEGVYPFPYTAVIVPAVILSYCLFKEFPGTERAIRKVIEPLIRWIMGLV